MSGPGISINIPSLYQHVFGLTPPFRAAGEQPGTSDFNYPGIVDSTESAEVFTYSRLGTPVYEEFMLQKPDGDTWTFDNTTLIDISRPKIIEKTKITGRNGQVKELISWDDYIITIRGFIISKVKNQYPVDEVATYMHWWKINSELRVYNEILNQVHGIHYLVLEDIDLPRLEGKPGVQPFKITALSDEPIELQLINNTVVIE